jgi:hypothetical protein
MGARLVMTDDSKARILDVVLRVLEEIGSECEGVQYGIDVVPIDGGMLAPAVILKWDPKIHPKTIYDPAQAIVLENMRNGRILSDDTIRRVLREKIEHMLKVDQHAHKELIDPGTAQRELEQAGKNRVHSLPGVMPSRVLDPRSN